MNLNLQNEEGDDGPSKMPNVHNVQLKFADTETVNDMMEVYNRTMHDKQDSQYPSQMESDDLSVPAETYDPVEQLEYMLKREVEKYQRAQNQKSVTTPPSTTSLERTHQPARKRCSHLQDDAGAGTAAAENPRTQAKTRRAEEEEETADEEGSRGETAENQDEG